MEFNVLISWFRVCYRGDCNDCSRCFNKDLNVKGRFDIVIRHRLCYSLTKKSLSGKRNFCKLKLKKIITA